MYRTLLKQEGRPRLPCLNALKQISLLKSAAVARLDDAVVTRLPVPPLQRIPKIIDQGLISLDLVIERK
jgi:hypothetical protein